MANGQQLADEAMALLHQGRTNDAAEAFERAAQAHLAEGSRPAAAAALSNAGQVRKMLGDLNGALAAIDQALGLLGETPTVEHGPVLLNRAGLLDRLGLSEQAGVAWLAAAACFTTQPPLQLFCQAHAAGTELRRSLTGAAGTAPPLAAALANAKAIVGRLGAQPDAGQLVGILGAIGESAGELRMAFLPQAMCVMARRLSGFNSSTLPYWDQFIHGIGDATPIALTMCSLAFLLVGMERDAATRGQLMRAIQPTLQRVARARGITIDQLFDQVQAGASAVTGVADLLANATPPELRLLA